MTGKPGQVMTLSRLTDGADPVEVWNAAFDSFPIRDGRMDGDRWMRRIWQEDGPIEPGRYVLVVTNRFEPFEVLRMEWDLPVAGAWAALVNDDRRFGFRVLDLYPGTTPALVGEHIEAFGDHYRARISTAELAEVTGYTLPEGVARPHYPPLTAAALAAKP